MFLFINRKICKLRHSWVEIFNFIYFFLSTRYLLDDDFKFVNCRTMMIRFNLNDVIYEFFLSIYKSFSS